MTYTYEWDESYPSVGDPANQMHVYIQTVVKMIRERLAVEHDAATGTDADTYVHSAGTARISQGTAANRPAAATANANKLYFATDTKVLSLSNGTTWTDVINLSAFDGVLDGASLASDLDADGSKVVGLEVATEDGDALTYEHKNADILDHPDASVTTDKIANDAVDADKVKDAVLLLGHMAASSGIAQLKIGSYVGNGNDSRNINAGVNLTAGFWFVLIVPSGDSGESQMPVFATSSHSTGYAARFGAIAATNLIQAATSTGFQIGDDNAVNKDNITFVYVVGKLA